MKAAQLNSYGDADSIQINNNAPKPAIRPGQVLVQAYAASVNPFDWKVREGTHKEYIKLELPAILGGDVAGTVTEIGAGVSGLEVGQPVYGMANSAGGQGAFAEFVPVSAAQLVAKPKSLDYVHAAALPLVGVSAYQALIDTMDLQRGQKILIHGGAGGIGSVAIQLAKHLGAYVATTASAADTNFVKSLGADEAVDYKKQDFSQVLRDFDAVLDTIGGETNAKSYKILRRGGVLVSMIEQPNERLVKNHGITYIQQSSKPTVERLTRVAELADSGKLKITIDKVFPFDQAAEALEHLKAGHSRGKVVIQIRE
jgi:NADPH:quinone reductase-like Zn-dependent oxidoreductase